MSRTKQQKGASHGERPFFQCEGGHKYFKVDVETKERPRKIPFFLNCDSGGHHSTRGEYEKVLFQCLGAYSSCIRDALSTLAFLS